jgi:ATP-dependent RNA helicase DDX24/MAK5
MGKKKRADELQPLFQDSNWRKIELTNEQQMSCEGLMSFEVFDPSDASVYPIISSTTEDQDDDETIADDNNSKSNLRAFLQQDSDDEQVMIAEAKKPKKKKKANKRKRKETEDKREEEDSEPIVTDMSKWSSFGIHQQLLDNIQKLGFSQPTPIQNASLQKAIVARKDIIAAAETGSGKTLAFVLPILTHILNSPSEEKKLRGLIIAPTRELSVQVMDHIKSVTKGTNIVVINITGGMSEEKQKRQLALGPHIIVATPGRYWDLTRRGLTHLTELDKLQFLVIDEADRMIAEGHFAELRGIIDYIKQKRKIYMEEGKKIPNIQNFVSSATLTLSDKWREYEETGQVPAEEQKKEKKKKKSKLNLCDMYQLKEGEDREEAQQQEEEEKTPTGTVDTLLHMMEFSNYAIIDLTTEKQLAGTLEECQIQCVNEDKLLYLYYFLYVYPGRTLIFANSIKRVRLIHSVLTILGVSIFALHGEMQQRQRLKNLDRFKQNENGVLVATDVAARGLDIENVKYVVHYQLPNTVDAYVHRCGRSGRAGTPGFSLALVSPEDRKYYQDICLATNKPDGIPLFPIDVDHESVYIPDFRKRIELASKIEMKTRVKKKVKSETNWLVKNAQELEIDLDENLMKEMKKEFKATDNDKELVQMQQRLKALMSKNLAAKKLPSAKYITSDLDRLDLLRNTITKNARDEIIKKNQAKTSEDTGGKRANKKRKTT